MKTCRDCGLTLPLESFAMQRGGKNGRHPVCKGCRNSAAKHYYLSNRERILAAQKGRVYKYYRSHDLKKKYDLSEEQYEALLKAQAFRCAICEGDNSGRTLAVDHCHRSGTVRGLLCDLCNRAIGQMGDNPDTLRKAAMYLERWVSG